MLYESSIEVQNLNLDTGMSIYFLRHVCIVYIGNSMGNKMHSNLKKTNLNILRGFENENFT